MAIWDLGWFARLIIGETHLFGAGDTKFFVGLGGEKPGFFENIWLQSVIWAKTRFLKFWVGRETGFFREYLIAVGDLGENPVSLVFMRRVTISIAA